MLRAGLSLAKGLAAARLLSGAAFQPAESLKALTYFRDGDLPGPARADRSPLIAASTACLAVTLPVTVRMDAGPPRPPHGTEEGPNMLVLPRQPRRLSPEKFRLTVDVVDPKRRPWELYRLAPSEPPTATESRLL